ncbi:putative radical SAM protein [Paratrimastix pyriformis]|uniref:Radical SAM protein n=1 Tax=Paratrimastix pyriformis TaxID=342808 RepID=A0ABQ8UAH3_9EUKA|nr:putative radical SAM protein [Paratrimastix pyriformis]
MEPPEPPPPPPHHPSPLPQQFTCTHDTRKSKILTPTRALQCLPSNFATVNVSAGCVHQCVYCFAAGYRHSPADGTICRVYDNLTEFMEEELASGRRPARLHLSPSCDPFQPIPEVQSVSEQLIRQALAHHIPAHFITKGVLIHRPFREYLVAHHEQVFMTVGLITLDPALQTLLEPGAAPPQARLAQAQWAVSHGIHCAVRVVPVLPGVTDTDAQMRALFTAIHATGVRIVSLSYLFLRPHVRDALTQAAQAHPELRPALAAFEHSVPMKLGGRGGAIEAMPAEWRAREYRRLVALAHECSGGALRVKICLCKNMDLPDQCCNCDMAGPVLSPAPAPVAPAGATKEQGAPLPDLEALVLPAALTPPGGDEETCGCGEGAALGDTMLSDEEDDAQPEQQAAPTADGDSCAHGAGERPRE